MDLLLQNLISPIVLAFALGIIAQWVKSDLEIPDALYQGISIYLLFAIGLKGGVALSETPLGEVVWPALGTLGSCVAQMRSARQPTRHCRVGCGSQEANFLLSFSPEADSRDLRVCVYRTCVWHRCALCRWHPLQRNATTPGSGRLSRNSI